MQCCYSSDRMHSTEKRTAYNFMGPFETGWACVDRCILQADLIGKVFELTAIHLCRKVLPQPKLRERSLPVPRGMTATAGGGSNCSSLTVFRIHATVPSPPAASMRSRLQSKA